MFRRSICFTTHPESHQELRTDFLGRSQRPDWAVIEKVKYSGLDYWEIGYELAYKLIKEKPSISWIYDFIERISSKRSYFGSYGSHESFDYSRNWHDELSHDEFSFEFQYHIQSLYCSEESESAIRVSTPLWFVIIRDAEGTVVHNNWTIMLNAMDGDLHLTRKGQKLFDHVRFDKDPLGKLTASIREFIRIRNFRMKRLGQQIPGTT